MKWLLPLLLLFVFMRADETGRNEHDLYLTLYMPSVHFSKSDTTDKKFNDTHKAYGIEYIMDRQYSLTYIHFINSRYKDVDAVGIGYLLNFNDDFGLQFIGGYQEGYCFNGLLNSVACQEDKSSKSAFLLPLLFYKHEYFKLDFFTNSDMLAFRLNIKIF